MSVEKIIDYERRAADNPDYNLSTGDASGGDGADSGGGGLNALLYMDSFSGGRSR